MTAASTAPDRDTIARFQSGERAAFEALYAEYARRVELFIKTRCPRGDDAEAIAQETWVRVWNARESYEDSSFSGWVFTIARRLIFDATRKVQRRPQSETIGDRDVAATVVEEYSAQTEALRHCLEVVDGEFVEVLRLQIGGMSTDEITEKLGIKTNTVYSRASRGRDDLRDCVERRLA